MSALETRAGEATSLLPAGEPPPKNVPDAIEIVEPRLVIAGIDSACPDVLVVWPLAEAPATNVTLDDAEIYAVLYVPETVAVAPL